jgi:predicted esterase
MVLSISAAMNMTVYQPFFPFSVNRFDLYDWPIAVGSKDDKEGLLDGVKSIEDHISKLQKEHGISPSKIVIGGFSQGGAVALLAAYRNKEAYAGCAGLSAWLTLPDELDVSEGAKNTPLFWGHGRFDDKVSLDIY